MQINLNCNQISSQLNGIAVYSKSVWLSYISIAVKRQNKQGYYRRDGLLKTCNSEDTPRTLHIMEHGKRNGPAEVASELSHNSQAGRKRSN